MAVVLTGPAVVTGLDRVVRGEVTLPGPRLGLIANPTSVDSRLLHAADLLANPDLRTGNADLELVALFGPEHGLRGDAQDMISVDGAADPRTGVPVYSLYGDSLESLEPTAEQLSGLDALIFDVQDVGARYYTYVWTMVYSLRACARAGLTMVVLDRPNPIGGDGVEGGLISPGFHSFVGLGNVPNRHGMTAGEIAQWAVEQEGLDVDLQVVEMNGWQRSMLYADTGLPWVMPSPNMPTCDTALVYPGMCLVEGTELSEARGTTRPFELSGAPGIDGAALAAELEGLPGARFRPLQFQPTFHKHAGVACGGVQIHVTDAAAFRPYLTGVGFLRAVRAIAPEAFAWRTRAYEFVHDKPAIDLLAGCALLREAIDAGAELGEIAAQWADGEASFRDSRGRWLLY